MLKQVEVIGGADKYMAVCRKCYFSPVNVPASPRLPLKTIDHQNGQENEASDEDLEVPHKRALFEPESIRLKTQ